MPRLLLAGSSAERGSTVTGGGVVSRRERLALTAGSKLLRLLAMMRWRGGLFSRLRVSLVWVGFGVGVVEDELGDGDWRVSAGAECVHDAW